MTILSEITKLLSRSHSITLAEANKLRKIAANLDNQDFAAARKDLNEGGGAAFTLAERKVLGRILGAEDADDSTTIANLQDEELTTKRINRGQTMNSGKKRLHRKLWKTVGENIATPATVLVQSSFTDVNETTLANHTPNMEVNLAGNPWVGINEAGGPPEVRNNRAASNNINNTSRAVIDTETTTRRIVTRVYHYPTDFNWAGHVARYIDEGNYIICRIKHTTPYMEIARESGNSFLTLATSDESGNTEGKTMTMTTVDDGSKITFTIDVDGDASYTLSVDTTLHNTTTKSGLYWYKGDSWHDDLYIYDI